MTPANRTSNASGRKKVLYAGMLLFLMFLLMEAGVRIIFAFYVGPKAFLYGTDYFRDYVLPPGSADITLGTGVDAHRKGSHSAVGNTDQQIGTGSGGYAKYVPGESKIDFDEFGDRFSVSISDRGFRGRNFELEKPPGTIRVVTLGASSTFGYYDRDDETYPHYLELELTKITENTKFEVLNLGIPHLTSTEILELFSAEALPLDADVITFYEGINDSSQMPETVWSAKKDTREMDSWVRRLRTQLGSMSLLRDVYVATRARLMIVALADSLLVSDVFTYDHKDLQLHVVGKSERFLKNVSALRKACVDRGIIFVVLSQQARSMMIEDVKGITYEDEIGLVRRKLLETGAITHQEKTFLTHKILMDDLKSWAAINGVPFADVIEALDQDRSMVVSWVHLNPRGNRVIATVLARTIVEELRKNGKLTTK
jgi:hypothetical protein